MNDAILKGNLERLRQLNAEETTLASEVAKLNQRLFNTRSKRDSLKDFLQQELAEVKIPWATAEFESIFQPSRNGSEPESNGHEPNKTHVVLRLVRDHSNQTPTNLYKFAEGYGISLNYFHTILGKLRKRELVDKDAKSRYFATPKGKALELDM